MVRETGVQSQKMVLDTVLLSTQHYKIIFHGPQGVLWIPGIIYSFNSGESIIVESWFWVPRVWVDIHVYRYSRVRYFHFSVYFVSDDYLNQGSQTQGRKRVITSWEKGRTGQKGCDGNVWFLPVIILTCNIAEELLFAFSFFYGYKQPYVSKWDIWMCTKRFFTAPVMAFGDRGGSSRVRCFWQE